MEEPIKLVSMENLKYFAQRLNVRLNDLFANGLHNCKSCGAPYTGKPVCEYCGRGFFVDRDMYRGTKE